MKARYFVLLIVILAIAATFLVPMGRRSQESDPNAMSRLSPAGSSANDQPEVASESPRVFPVGEKNQPLVDADALGVQSGFIGTPMPTEGPDQHRSPGLSPLVSAEDKPAPLPEENSRRVDFREYGGAYAEFYGESPEASPKKPRELQSPKPSLRRPSAQKHPRPMLSPARSAAGGRVGSSRYSVQERQASPTMLSRQSRSRLVESLSLVRKPAQQLSAEALTIHADEVWVIVKPQAATQPSGDTSGCGSLLANTGEKKDVPLPLKHTEVKADISGYIATVDVTQQFHNPFDTKIEATYVFPLAQNAAIHDFLMTIGERTIRGIIRERAEAVQIYQQARAQGHVASLLTQERPNIFTQKVANIEPGKRIDVNIKYFSTLAYDDGWYEFVFPMVVGPRYNPPGSKEGVGAVARGQSGASQQATEVSYLAPNERSGHDIALTCKIDAGVTIEESKCNSHVIKTETLSPSTVAVELSQLDRIPNKDFVFRYRVAGDRIKSNFMTHRDERGGYFSLMVYPPAELQTLKRSAMEMIFVLDCSGSMRGQPIAQAKKAIKRALKQLQPGDTFQVIRFSSNASQLGPQPLPATADNVSKAMDYVDGLKGSGGTQMIEGIKAALDFKHDAERLRLVSFMTDGFIGNEAQILAAVQQKLGDARIFSFGVGTSVNRYLLDRMAKLGKGAVAYVGLDDDPTDAVDRFIQRISHPALTDVSIDFGALQAQEIFPSRLPDLFVGRPLLLTGRFKGDGAANIVIKGQAGGKTRTISLPVDLNAAQTHPGIASVWARKQIEQLSAQQESESAVTKVALSYHLMSAYTAFVAVDSSRRTAGNHGVSVKVPVPVPEGVRYDTTVQN